MIVRSGASERTRKWALPAWPAPIKVTMLRVRPLYPQGPAKGLSLLETLVVLSLLSLLCTLVLQGLGAFVGRYDTVQRVHRDAASAVLPRHWFVTSVRGLVPTGVLARRFQGDASAFEGTTLQPLAAESGLSTRVRWRIEGAAGQVVTVAEDDADAWQVLVSRHDGLAFEYAGADGEWHAQWPSVAAPGEWVPRMIRLTAQDAGAIWSASIAASPQPAFDERVLLGQ